MHTIAKIHALLTTPKDFSPSEWANENKSLLEKQSWQGQSDETLVKLLISMAYAEKYDIGWLTKWENRGELQKLMAHMQPMARAKRIQKKAIKTSALFKVLAYLTLLAWPSLGFYVDILTGFDMAMIPSAIGFIIGIFFFYKLYIGPLGSFQTALAEILIPPIIKENKNWILTWRTLTKKDRKPYNALAPDYTLGVKHIMSSKLNDCSIEFLFANGRKTQSVSGNFMRFIKTFYILHITGPKATEQKTLILETLHKETIMKIIENENELMVAYIGNWFFMGWRPKWTLQNNSVTAKLRRVLGIVK